MLHSLKGINFQQSEPVQQAPAVPAPANSPPMAASASTSTASSQKGDPKGFFADFQGTPCSKNQRSFPESANFFDDFLDEVLTRDPDDKVGSTFDSTTCTLDDLANWLDDASHSSAFSGVAAPETALLGLHRAVQGRLRDRQARG